MCIARCNEKPTLIKKGGYVGRCLIFNCHDALNSFGFPVGPIGHHSNTRQQRNVEGV
jgi:hypothetical protein